MHYQDYIKDKKSSLDNIILNHKAEPVGWGYIDVICHRSQIETLINQVVDNGFVISVISWWEYLDNNKRRPLIGMGGPVSMFYKRWYTEINEYDYLFNENAKILNMEYNLIKQDKIELYEIIKNKKTKNFGGKYLTYNVDECLTPALWIEVPDDWVNPYYSPDKLVFLPEYEKLMDENRKEVFA